MKWLLLLLLTGCAPSYWMFDSDLRAARAGNVSSVPATRNADGDDPVRLQASSLESAQPEQIDGPSVRVTPRHTRHAAGWAIFGIGAVLTAAGIGAGLRAIVPSTSDESAWLPQLVAGSTLGSIGGLSMIIGGAIAGTSTHEAEVR